MKNLNSFKKYFQKKPKLKLEKDDPNLTIHKISDNELRLKFNTSLENGLDTLYAKEILAKGGCNISMQISPPFFLLVIISRKPNIFVFNSLDLKLTYKFKVRMIV